jgi:DNA modification methylase
MPTVPYTPPGTDETKSEDENLAGSARIQLWSLQRYWYQYKQACGYPRDRKKEAMKPLKWSKLVTDPRAVEWHEVTMKAYTQQHKLEDEFRSVEKSWRNTAGLKDNDMVKVDEMASVSLTRLSLLLLTPTLDGELNANDCTELIPTVAAAMDTLAQRLAKAFAKQIKGNKVLKGALAVLAEVHKEEDKKDDDNKDGDDDQKGEDDKRGEDDKKGDDDNQGDDDNHGGDIDQGAHGLDPGSDTGSVAPVPRAKSAKKRGRSKILTWSNPVLSVSDQDALYKACKWAEMDALAYCEELGSKAAHAIVTDGPWNVLKAGLPVIECKGGKKENAAKSNQRRDDDILHQTDMPTLAKAFYDVLKASGVLLMRTSWEMYNPWVDALNEAFFTVSPNPLIERRHQKYTRFHKVQWPVRDAYPWIVAIKATKPSFPHLSLALTFMPPECETHNAFMVLDGAIPPTKVTGAMLCSPDGKTQHRPQQQAINTVLTLLLRYTKPGDIVLDPMCGTGTVARACLRTGRMSLNSDKHHEHFKDVLLHTHRYYWYPRVMHSIVSNHKSTLTQHNQPMCLVGW